MHRFSAHGMLPPNEPTSHANLMHVSTTPRIITSLESDRFVDQEQPWRHFLVIRGESEVTPSHEHERKSLRLRNFLLDFASFCRFRRVANFYSGTEMFSRSVNTAVRFPLVRSSLSRPYGYSKFPRASKRNPEQDIPRYPSSYQPRINHASFQPPQLGSSNRVKWARRSALMATLMAAGLGVTWVTCRDKVPITERNRFNCLSTNWMLRNAYKFNVGERVVFEIIQAVPFIPNILLPDEHPATLAVRAVFDRLIAASSGLETSALRIDIVSAPGEFRILSPSFAEHANK